MTELLVAVGTVLGRPAEDLVEIDRRPLVLVFVPGTYVTVTVRDGWTRQVHEVTLDPATGTAHDRAELRARDRSAGAALGTLASDLLTLMLRHPTVVVPVRLVTAVGVRELSAAAPEIATLAARTEVVHIDLLGDPAVPDR